MHGTESDQTDGQYDGRARVVAERKEREGGGARCAVGDVGGIYARRAGGCAAKVRESPHTQKFANGQTRVGSIPAFWRTEA